MHSWWEYKIMQLLVKTVWPFLRGLNRELLNDPAVTLLGMYPGERKNIYVYIKSSMQIFITAFFIIAQSENSPNVHHSKNG